MNEKKRKKRIDDAIANERLGGLDISTQVKKISDDYISGKIPLEEASRRIRQRYGAL